jgi:hypothetical protein
MLPERLLIAEPSLSAALRAYIEGVFAHPALPAGVLDRCRARIAALLGAQGAASTEAPDTAVDEVTAACLAFAEQFLLDAQGLDDVTVGRVLSAVGEEGYAVLTIGVGLAEGLTRAQLAWGLPATPVGAAGRA